MCFRFWLFLFSVVLVFCLDCVCFSLSVFLLLCWLCFWCFLFSFVFCFCLLSCFGFNLWTKSCFPSNYCFFWVMLVKRVVWFYVLCFCSCLFFLCCFFPFLRIHLYYFASVLLFFVTRLSDLLVCILWSLLVCILWSFFLFCFLLFCFELFLFLFFHSSQKKTPQKTDTAKTQKNKNAEKRTKKKELAQLCSQIVFFNFLGWA